MAARKSNVRTFWVVTTCFAIIFSVVQVIKERQREDELIARAGGISEALPKLGKIGDFSLTDQAGHPFSQAALAGRVWVLNFIFTRCGSTCPLVTHNISGLGKVFARYPEFRLVSMTTDPGNDTPEVLASYARSYHADPEQWAFLTGPSDKIVAFAMKQAKLAVGATPEIHTTKVALVDQMGEIRGYFDATDSGQMELIRAHIKLLLTERNGRS
jgi:protein SCO1/2